MLVLNAIKLNQYYFYIINIIFLTFYEFIQNFYLVLKIFLHFKNLIHNSIDHKNTKYLNSDKHYNLLY